MITRGLGSGSGTQASKTCLQDEALTFEASTFSSQIQEKTFKAEGVS